MRNVTRRLTPIGATTVVVVAFGIWSQPSPRAQVALDVNKITIKTTRIVDNFYVLDNEQEAGGAISVLTGTDGILMVDAGIAPLATKVEAAIRSLSAQPIRYVINTHVHEDQTGANGYFGDRGATIVAREEVRRDLLHRRPLADGRPRAPIAAAGLPRVTYSDRMTLSFNGEDITLIAVPRAHTDGDTLIHFPRLDIIVAGDVLRPIPYPSINRPSGGTLQGTIDALGVLIGRAGPNTKIVTSHGPAVGRAVAIAQRDLVLTVRDRVAALMAQGKTVDQVVAARVTADLESKAPASHTPADRFVRDVYSELASTFPIR